MGIRSGIRFGIHLYAYQVEDVIHVSIPMAIHVRVLYVLVGWGVLTHPNPATYSRTFSNLCPSIYTWHVIHTYITRRSVERDSETGRVFRKPIGVHKHAILCACGSLVSAVVCALKPFAELQIKEKTRTCVDATP